MAASRGKKFLWLAGGSFCLLVAVFLFRLLGPSPPIVISPQTTYITGPLGEDGLPDYARWLLERNREGVTPENNAAVLLWRALWPGDIMPQHRLAMADELGLHPLPPEDQSPLLILGDTNVDGIAAYLGSLEGLAGDGGQASEEAPDSLAAMDRRDELRELASEAIQRAGRRPWRSAELPPLAAWIGRNEQRLDLIVEASTRSRFYSPPPNLINGVTGYLLNMLLPHAQTFREVGRALPARAMRHLGEGRHQEAWRDLLAVYRLGQLEAQEGDILVEQLVAMATSGLAVDGMLSLLADESLTESDAAQILSDLRALPAWDAIARPLDETERAWALQSVQFLARGKFERNGLANMNMAGAMPLGLDLLQRSNIDWNRVLREINQSYDRYAEALELPERAEREAALSAANGDVGRMLKEIQSNPLVTLPGAVLSRKQRSSLVARIYLNILLPSLDTVQWAQDRANAELELLRTAAALAVYRTRHRHYPETLEGLVPDVIERLPADLYSPSGGALIYMPDDDGKGFVLYSVYLNGRDDGGTSDNGQIVSGRWVTEPQSVDRDDSDLVIRFPMPAFELPRLEAEAGP